MTVAVLSLPQRIFGFLILCTIIAVPIHQMKYELLGNEREMYKLQVFAECGDSYTTPDFTTMQKNIDERLDTLKLLKI